ncbi:dimethyladenosine transferase 1, mitochondrial isoform X1 [Hydra vulgaris]|nr:dimethyladenosine transferase 1, mitochondrial isoform X1 [Hydra vulgaris]
MSSATKQLRLPPMPRISDLMRLYGLRAKKQLSQNFILDLNVTDKIARKADVFDCNVIEVGSGPGSLSRSLLNAGLRHLYAVEIDKRFLPSLELLQDASDGHMSIYHADILKFDMVKPLKNVISAEWESDDLPNIRLVGNLPFSVSIPLFLQWLEALSTRSGVFSFGRIPMTLVFQKEVGQNMVAEALNYDRSRLAIMAQNYCHVSRAMEISSSVFVPEPKVDAWLMHFIPLKKPAIDAPFNVVEQVVKAIFSKRRKIIKTPLRRLFPENERLADELLDRIKLDTNLRPHQLELHDFNLITKEFMKICNENDYSLTPLPVNKPDKIVNE